MSDKLRILSFISIVLVIYIHTYYSEGASMSGLNIIETFLGKGVCLVAVPLFFVISGYLFYLHCSNGIHSIWPKMLKRVRTLLVPYLIMNTLAILFYVILNLLVDNIPFLGSVVNFRILNDIHQESWYQILINFYWLNPVAFQLWFIRDLIVVIVFTPVIYLILRQAVRNVYGIVGFLILEILLIYLSSYIHYFSAAFWFIAGGFIAMHPSVKPSYKTQTSWKVLILILIALAIIIWNTITQHYIFKWIIPFLGICALWFGFDILCQKRTNILSSNKKLNFLCAYPFFVYLIHEPLLNILKKFPLLFSKSELCLIVAYIVIPPIFYICGALIGKRLKHITPRLYNIFTGGR